MTRLHVEDINTPEWFDAVWRAEGVHGFDSVRLEEFLKGVGPSDHVLDVGAGWMGIAQYAVERGRLGIYSAIDFSREAKYKTLLSLGDKAGSLSYHIGDALDTRYMSGGFDRVCCGELIEHMERPEDLVAELFRVCVPRGRVIIGTLNDKCAAAQAFGDYPEHLWSFSPSDLLRLVETHSDECRYWLCPGGQYHFVEGVKR